MVNVEGGPREWYVPGRRLPELGVRPAARGPALVARAVSLQGGAQALRAAQARRLLGPAGAGAGEPLWETRRQASPPPPRSPVSGTLFLCSCSLLSHRAHF